MDFSKRMQKILDGCTFCEDGYYVWCGSMFKYADKYYITYSRWKRSLGFEAWVTDSEICLASANSMFGEFKYIKTLRTKDNLGNWDSSCAHNPTILTANEKHYLFYTGNDGNGDWWVNRNRQRIGVASAINPEGEWNFQDKPLIDISIDNFDSLMVSNPSVTATPDGRFLMIYKGVSKEGIPPRGGAVVCGAAFSDKPDGIYNKTGSPIMVNPTNGWSVEDPFVFYEGDKFYTLVKDFQGYFTKTPRSATALFESINGVDWYPSDHPLAYECKLDFVSGMREVFRLERPQLYFEDGKARLLICACAEDKSFNNVYNVRIPLEY